MPQTAVNNSAYTQAIISRVSSLLKLGFGTKITEQSKFLIILIGAY